MNREYRLSPQETTYLNLIIEQSKQYYPTALMKAIIAYLAGDGSLADVYDEWQNNANNVNQAGVYYGYGYGQVYYHLRTLRGERLSSFSERLIDIALVTNAVPNYFQSICTAGPIEESIQYLRQHDITEEQIIIWASVCRPFLSDSHSDFDNDDNLDEDAEDEDVGGDAPTAPDQLKALIQLQPTHIGNFFLSYATDHLTDLQRYVGPKNPDYEDFWSALVPLLATNEATIDTALTVAQQLTSETLSYCLPHALRVAPQQFHTLARRTLLDSAVTDYRKSYVILSLIQNAAAQQQDLLENFIRDGTTIFSSGSWGINTAQRNALTALHQLDPVATAPLVEICLDSENVETVALAIQIYTTDSELEQTRVTRLQGMVAERPMKVALAATNALLNHPWQGRIPYAQTLLTHRHRLVREAAIDWWQKQQEANLFELLSPLLAHGNAEVRLTAIHSLHKANSAQADPLLRQHYTIEKSLKVKQALEAIFATMDAPTHADKVNYHPEDTTAAIAKLCAELACTSTKRWQAPSWLDWTHIAQIQWVTGEPVPVDAMRGLFYRQAQLKKMQLDTQAHQAASLMNRTQTATLAQSLFSGWLADGAKTPQNWLLPLIAAFTDDTLVPEIRKQIDKQRKGARSMQLASVYTQMLAQIGTPLALSEVRTLVQTGKRPAIRRTARQAFAKATSERSLSVDDFDDEIVPRLGFDSTGRQSIHYGSRLLTVQLGPHLDLQLWDEGGELLQTLPRAKAKDDSATMATLKQQWLNLKKQVQQTAITQSERLDQACSRRRSWSIERWQQLFLEHPVLHSLGMAYVWEAKDDTNEQPLYFRITADGLLNCDEAAVTLPAAGAVCLAHALQMGADLRDRWLEELATYDIEPRIAQLARPTHTLEERQRQEHSWLQNQRYVVLFNDLMNIARRTGWELPDPDAYQFDTLYKTFPVAGIAAILAFGKVWTGNNRYTTTALIKLGFVPMEAIKDTSTNQASAESDEEEEDENEDNTSTYQNILEAHSLALGDVPAFVFSEASSDVAMIAAKGAYDPQWRSR